MAFAWQRRGHYEGGAMLTKLKDSSEINAASIGWRHARPVRTLLATLIVAVVVPAAASADTAYVTNFGDGTVSVIDTASNTSVGAPIDVPGACAVDVTPDGTRAYVVRCGTQGSVVVIDTASNEPVGGPIPVGASPSAIAITPDGTRAYVVNTGPVEDGIPDSVSVISTATNATVASITVGNEPGRVAFSADGGRAFVTNFRDNTVSAIDTATNTLISCLGAQFDACVLRIQGAFGIATLRGPLAGQERVLVTGLSSDSFVFINADPSVPTSSNEIPAIDAPGAIEVIPNPCACNGTAYIASRLSNSVLAIANVFFADGGGDVRTTIPVGAPSWAIDVAPDRSRVFVTTFASPSQPGAVAVIDASTKTTVGSPIPVGRAPMDIAIRDTAPETTITSGPANGTASMDTTPTFEFSSSEAGSFECRIDGGPWQSCQSPYTTSALAAAQHTFAVRATDTTGHTDLSPAQRTFTVVTDPRQACATVTPTITGTNGPNTINGTAGPDLIAALDGNDTVSGRAGDDVICGGAGDDTLNGDNGNDIVDSGAGNDKLAGGAGDDTLILRHPGLISRVDCGPGNDRLIKASGGLQILFTNCERIEQL